MSEPNRFGGFVGLWIIEKESGLPLTSFELEEKAQIDSVLFGGFLVAIRGFMTDLEIGQLNSFRTDTADLLITGSDKIISVLAISKDINADLWYPILVVLHRKSEEFYTEYKKRELVIDTTKFDILKPQFRETILKNVQNLEKLDRELNDSEFKDLKKPKKAAKKLEDSGLW
ncbi:MAG: hypothetical protein ACFFAJ_17780 [Candidatus Hodarchaeota archaeon]